MPSSVAALRPDSTLAEPDLWADLRTCQETVSRDWYGHELPAQEVEAVLAAAERVERGVQERLEALGGLGTVIDLRSARALWNAQWQAHMAIVAKAQSRRPHKDAQKLRAGTARGRVSLTVCVGYVFRRFDRVTMRLAAPDMFDEENYPGRVPLVPLGCGDGCGRIIEDRGMGKPGPPKRYCDGCAAKAGRTMNAGLTKNALARLRAGRKRGRF
jgi:hypothetical protein